MSNTQKKEIISLFENYRYKFLKESDDVLIFEYATGMYSGVEIVPLNEKSDTEQIEEIKKDYSRAGYATHLYEKCDIKQIQRDLFNGFFQTKLANEKIKNKYRKYCERVMLQFGKRAEDYQYIEVPFEKEVDFYETKSEENLVDSIFSMLQGDGARLIILEAPAGFGKTSTTYEVLHRYQNVHSDVRPFMMELYRDRTASIFKYILLSNIDADFDVNIKSDIVIDNIKAGRIPLLVDGFDELLSKDIDKGGAHVEFKDVESMLSTIADLLKGNAKIMLTSRKTAIFSSEEFVDWYDRLLEKGLDFQVVKYSLNYPTIKDWLSKEEIEKYDINLLKALNNPVLLSFMKYCGKELGHSNNGVVDKFFDLLLTREIDRQDLPFSTNEQQTIMMRLAFVFAGLNITTDTRSDVMSYFYETSKKLITSKISVSRDLEGLLNSLANHALLNRRNDKIGFLNDFIFGVMLAKGFLHYQTDNIDVLGIAADIQPEYLNKCINAAIFLPKEAKKKIWKSLNSHILFNSSNSALCDWKLVGCANNRVENISFDDDRISDCIIGSQNGEITNCTFSNIVFTGCTFDFNYLSRCSFVICTFIDCIREGENYSCYEYGCIDESEILKIDENNQPIVPDIITDDNVKLSILQKYFMVGEKRRRMKLISAIRRNYVDNEKQFKRCLDSLASDQLLIINGDKSFITNEGIQWLQSNKCQL